MNTNLTNTNPTTNPMSAQKSCTTSCATDRNRFNPLGWSSRKKATAAIVGAIVLTGLWAAFRPELLFVNNKVNESFPALSVGQNAPSLLSQGEFTSLAHHTEGKAALYKRDNGYTLRLSNFSTSNGPDVHVYVTEGDGTDNDGIKASKFLDLGVIKGNIGDQNYALPAGFDPEKYQGVSIWCKRFGVNFAGASLTSAKNSVVTQVAAQTIPAAATSETKSVVVTTGAFHQVAHATKGMATITEDSKGKRTLTLRGFQTGKGPQLRLYLWKAENVKDNATAKKLVAGKQFVDLGALKNIAGTQTYAVPKGIDLWQFLAVGVWCDKFDVNFGTAPLASPQ